MVNLIRRRDPLDPASSMLPVMNRLMSQFFNDPYLGDVTNSGLTTFDETVLPLDISEDNDTVYVRASVPGFSPDDIQIDVQNGILSIRAEKTQEMEETDEKFHRRERVWGSMSRRVALPTNVQGDRINAELNNGVLTLEIPKAEEAKPRRIQIKAGQQQGQQLGQRQGQGQGQPQASTGKQPQTKNNQGPAY